MCILSSKHWCKWIQWTILSSLKEKLLLEKNEEIILMGNVYINLLRYNEDHSSTKFLNQIYSCSLIPCITSQSRIKNSYRQYLFHWHSKQSNCRRYFNVNIWLSSPVVIFKRFDPKVFLQVIQNIDWHTVLKLKEEDLDNLFDQLFLITEAPLDAYAPKTHQS